MKTIIDVSNVVYGGHYGSIDKRVAGFPVGGIRKLLGIINAGINQTDYILCFDGAPTKKKELFPEYKAGRVPNYSVMAQIDLLQEILQDCNIPFYLVEDKEADDVICSVIYDLAILGDPDRIVVYSDDRDLACCVGEKCTLKNTTSNGKTIDKNSFEDRVVQGERVPYNTILLHKIVNGDKSDNYPGVNVHGLRFEELAYAYLGVMSPYLSNGSFPEAAFLDVSIFNAVMDELSDRYDEPTREAIKKHAELVYPQLFDVTAGGVDKVFADMQERGLPLFKVEKDHFKVFGQGDFNRQKFDMYCSVLGLNRCRVDRYGDRFSEDVEEFKAKLKLRSKELASGVSAVERYRKVTQAAVEPPTVITNMELPI